MKIKNTYTKARFTLFSKIKHKTQHNTIIIFLMSSPTPSTPVPGTKDRRKKKRNKTRHETTHHITIIIVIVNLNSFGCDFGLSSLRVCIFKRLLSNFRQKFSEYFILSCVTFVKQEMHKTIILAVHSGRRFKVILGYLRLS